MVKRFITVTIFAFSLLALQVFAQGSSIYRYKDNQGNEFIGSQVPAEYVKNGYEVINDRGQVIRVVARTLTDEERAAQADSLEEQRLAEEAVRRQEEEDTLLLRLYRAPEEVVRRRDTTIEELDAQLSVLNALLEGAEESLESIEERIQNNINADREPPANLLAQQGTVSEERDRLNRQISRIENEKEETIITAEKNISRLRELLNLD